MAYRRRYASKRRHTRKRKGTTVRKPYGGSKYGNDFFTKIEIIKEVSSYRDVVDKPATSGIVACAMRSCPGSGEFGMVFLNDSPEFLGFKEKFANFEIKGMRMESVTNDSYIWNNAVMAAGLTPGRVNQAVNDSGPDGTYPTVEELSACPLQKDLNCNQTVNSMYYSFSKDLKNAGAQFGFSSAAFPTLSANASAAQLANQGTLFFAGNCRQLNNTVPVENLTVAQIKCTWYLRFHGRTEVAKSLQLAAYGSKVQKNSGFKKHPESDEVRFDPLRSKVKDPPKSQISYQDLQAQLNELRMQKDA